MQCTADPSAGRVPRRARHQSSRASPRCKAAYSYVSRCHAVLCTASDEHPVVFVITSLNDLCIAEPCNAMHSLAVHCSAQQRPGRVPRRTRHRIFMNCYSAILHGAWRCTAMHSSAVQSLGRIPRRVRHHTG